MHQTLFLAVVVVYLWHIFKIHYPHMEKPFRIAILIYYLNTL